MRVELNRGSRVAMECLAMPDPVRGIAHVAAPVVGGNDVVLQQLVQRFGFFAPAARVVEALRHRLDRPAVLAVVALVPPTVQHRQVDHAVDAGLHAGRAARLERVDRIVQPHVHPGHQPARQAQVVVLDQQDAALELGHPRDLGDAADQVLARLVGGVGLAGEQQAAPGALRRRPAAGASPDPRTPAWRACRSRSGGRSRWSARWG